MANNGEPRYFAWACCKNSNREMDDIQVSKVRSRISSSSMFSNEAWCFDVLLRPLTNRART